MKPFYVLPLLALTLLSACGNKDDASTQLSGGIVDGNAIVIPGEEGPEGQTNLQMIRAGLHEANEVRRRRGLPRLNHDINLTIAAQQKARELCRGRGNGPQYPQYPQNPGYPGNGGGDGDYYRQDDNSDGVPALPALGGQNQFQSQAYMGGRGPRGPQQPQYPQYPQYPQQQPGMAVENSARGLRDVQQVFAMWQQRPMYSQNLFSPAFHRQGIGYCGGVWIHLLAN